MNLVCHMILCYHTPYQPTVPEITVTQCRTGHALLKLSCSRRTRKRSNRSSRFLVNDSTHQWSHHANNLCIYSGQIEETSRRKTDVGFFSVADWFINLGTTIKLFKHTSKIKHLYGKYTLELLRIHFKLWLHACRFLYCEATALCILTNRALNYTPFDVGETNVFSAIELPLHIRPPLALLT